MLFSGALGAPGVATSACIPITAGVGITAILTSLLADVLLSSLSVILHVLTAEVVRPGDTSNFNRPYVSREGSAAKTETSPLTSVSVKLTLCAGSPRHGKPLRNARPL